MRRSFVVLVMFALLIGACSGGSDVEAEGAGDDSPGIPEEATATPESSPTEEEGPSGEVEAQADEIISCLKDQGLKAKFEAQDFPTYEEQGEIGVTFEYEELKIKVPDAVTIYLHDSPQAAQKTQKGINENLLEGDSEAEVVGTLVVDDFGTTLDEPEAAEQAASLESCLS